MYELLLGNLLNFSGYLFSLACKMGTNSTIHLKYTLEQCLCQVKLSMQLANIIIQCKREGARFRRKSKYDVAGTQAFQNSEES